MPVTELIRSAPTAINTNKIIMRAPTTAILWVKNCCKTIWNIVCAVSLLCISSAVAVVCMFKSLVVSDPRIGKAVSDIRYEVHQQHHADGNNKGHHGDVKVIGHNRVINKFSNPLVRKHRFGQNGAGKNPRK